MHPSASRRPEPAAFSFYARNFLFNFLWVEKLDYILKLSNLTAKAEDPPISSKIFLKSEALNERMGCRYKSL